MLDIVASRYEDRNGLAETPTQRPNNGAGHRYIAETPTQRPNNGAGHRYIAETPTQRPNNGAGHRYFMENAGHCCERYRIAMVLPKEGEPLLKFALFSLSLGMKR
ncbi:hypothetical protein FPL14_09210 [Cohnella cholangitidis]|uniref:Uncharacterized protein n=1 Tax=Cohnella cholangitidis TaxID=2598458 RepID=A0A7G5BWL4_9BACL|nr:hypothetical protein FPL14_09210 [Cohnella cholangitidis]